MHTPETIESLTEDEARALLNDLAAQHYGHDRWKAQLARDIGLTADGVKNWNRKGNRPPALVIMWLETTLRRNKAEALIANFGALVEAAQTFGNAGS